MFIEINDCFVLEISEIVGFKQYINRLGDQLCIIYLKHNETESFLDKKGDIYNKLKELLSAFSLFVSKEKDNKDDGKIRW